MKSDSTSDNREKEEARRILEGNNSSGVVNNFLGVLARTRQSDVNKRNDKSGINPCRMQACDSHASIAVEAERQKN